MSLLQTLLTATLLAGFSAFLSAQTACGGPTSFQILHYTETAGFDHNTRSQSATMFTEIGQAENFTIVNSASRSAFDDLTTLMGYEVIVFSNTSGNIPFSATQRANLESYVAGGGAVLGIHAATDMYRDGSYFFFSDLMGGSRRNSPAHTSNSFNGTMDVVGAHPSTANLPTVYPKQEEYYYWPDSGLVADITPVLEVRSTGSNSYDAARPISWYRELDSGARSFYTALGHARSNYTTATNDFRQHLRDALCWCVEAQSASLPVLIRDVRVSTDGKLDRIDWSVGGDLPARVELYGGDARGDLRVLQTVERPGTFTGTLEQAPADPSRHRYYRLRFYDPAGVPAWSPVVIAAAEARARVESWGDTNQLVWPGTERPEGVVLFDAGGRRIAALRLRGERTELPPLRPGVYFLRGRVGEPGLRFVVGR